MTHSGVVQSAFPSAVFNEGFTPLVIAALLIITNDIIMKLRNSYTYYVYYTTITLLQYFGRDDVGVAAHKEDCKTSQRNNEPMNYIITIF